MLAEVERRLGMLGIADIRLIRGLEVCEYSFGYTRTSPNRWSGARRETRRVEMPARLNLFDRVGNQGQHPVLCADQKNEAFYVKLDEGVVLRGWPRTACQRTSARRDEARGQAHRGLRAVPAVPRALQGRWRRAARGLPLRLYSRRIPWRTSSSASPRSCPASISAASASTCSCRTSPSSSTAAAPRWTSATFHRCGGTTRMSRWATLCCIGWPLGDAPLRLGDGVHHAGRCLPRLHPHPRERLPDKERAAFPLGAERGGVPKWDQTQQEIVGFYDVAMQAPAAEARAAERWQRPPSALPWRAQ